MAVTTDDAMVWSCQLALAVASEDVEAMRGIISEVHSHPGGVPLLLTTMAGTIASLVQESTGPNWREGLEAVIKSLQDKAA